MPHQLISSNTTWENVAGFSRAVRIGALIYVAGTTASDQQGQTVCVGDAAGQTRFILQKIQHTLDSAGSTLADIVRTRIYITRYRDWEGVARAHGEVFKDIRPANTLVVVRSLVPDDALVEIEVDAVVG